MITTTAMTIPLRISCVFVFGAIFLHDATAFLPSSTRPLIDTTTCLSMSLKPAALPLMDSGKALARSGELLVDLTTSLDLYGGALSSAGAFIRNGGDCVAQAAASCRFKTGAELVCDELREAATCLTEATVKMQQAIEEAEQDQDTTLAKEIGAFSISFYFSVD